jgi:hypothetical protein
MAGLGLGGCETEARSVVVRFEQCTQVAEPIAPAKPVETQPPLAKVAVAPIIGAPDGIAKQIQEEFSGAVGRQRVSVSATKDERVDYTLRGYIVAAKDKNGTKVSYIWDVTDASGKRVNRITGEEIVSVHSSKDPWAAITPSVAQSVAGKAANSFVSWVSNQGSQGGAVANNSTTCNRQASVRPNRLCARRRARPTPRGRPIRKRRRAPRRAALPATSRLQPWCRR